MVMGADIDTLVIGAGVVGLAIARALAARGHETLVVEAGRTVGQGVSSRNSEVVHAGLYYPAGSLKARFCVEGREKLYAFCQRHNVPHGRPGKIIVATNEAQRAQALAIHERARLNGVELALLDRDAMKALEPEIEGVLGLHSPLTGVVDSHALMLALQGEAESHGAAFAFSAPVVGGRVREGGVEISCGGAEPLTLLARRVVLAAGLSSPRLARAIAGLPQAQIPRASFAKGSYFSLVRPSPFSRLVYPAPEPGGLGVHITLDLAGRARFGPDVEWLDVSDERDIDYTVDPRRAETFYAAVRRYWPGLRDGELTPDYSGVRPRISGPGEAARDFLTHGPQIHGVSGLVCLYGIESPGLTSSLAIGDHAAHMLSP